MTMTLSAAQAAAIRDLDDQLRAAMQPTDWYFIRFADPSSGADVPAEVVAARSSLRAVHATRCMAIAEASDEAAIITIMAGQ